MAKALMRNGNGLRPGAPSKYDAHNTVLTKTYGALADLRRELADSKTTVTEREDLLRTFAVCSDSQRAWLLLEDYFEKLALSRKDFPSTDWWPRLLSATGKSRLEEVAFLFLRAKRSVPTELAPYANLDRFLQVEEAAREQQLVKQLEEWLFPPRVVHMDTPRASLRVVCTPEADPEKAARCRLAVQIHLSRQRTGDKVKCVAEIVELMTRAAHEQELFLPADWEFIEWLAGSRSAPPEVEGNLVLADIDLLNWLTRWGHTRRLELVTAGGIQPLVFNGDVAQLTPCLENEQQQLAFTHRLNVPGQKSIPVSEVRFFNDQPPLVLAGNTFFLLRNAPPPQLIEHWVQQPSVPVSKLSHRLLTHLRRSQLVPGMDWDQLVVAHCAKPQFVFELLDETVRLRLIGRSQRDQSVWIWNGHEWLWQEGRKKPGEKPEILDDPRLEAATQWLRQLDWFTPEPGLWVGDANEGFLGTLAQAWQTRPPEADYLGNPAFHRLFLNPRQLKPQIIVKGSGIDWLAVSAEWEQEGLKLTPADLQRLQTATGRFVKLPDAGWVELDSASRPIRSRNHGGPGRGRLDPCRSEDGHGPGRAPGSRKASSALPKRPDAKALRERLRDFKGVPIAALPANVQAELRPYQKDGFDFLCHLARIKLGGVLADDMGLGKTLQTLAWLAWLQANDTTRIPSPPSSSARPRSCTTGAARPSRFTPQLKVLVLESGAARHNLRKQIPQHDLIVTNYALLRRDLEELQKFAFPAP